MQSKPGADSLRAADFPERVRSPLSRSKNFRGFVTQIPSSLWAISKTFRFTLTAAPDISGREP